MNLLFKYCLLFIVCFSVSSFVSAQDFTINKELTGKFGLEIISKISSSGNAIISPYSLQAALVLAYEGAEGGTRQEMKKVLHYPADDTKLSQIFASLQQDFRLITDNSEKSEEDSFAYRKSDRIEISTVNRIYGQSGFNFKKTYLDLLSDEYKAPFLARDFITSYEAIRAEINLWVENETQSKIKELLGERSLDESTAMVLLNTLYFKAGWATPFDKNNTKLLPFYKDDGNTINCETMNLIEEMEYSKHASFTVISIPYTSNDLRFVIFLPDKNVSIGQVDSELLSIDKLEKKKLSLYLPKFKFSSQLYSMRDILISLGMSSAFDVPSGSADFSRIADKQPDKYLAISKVFHKTFFSLDEEGTEAAAASAVIIRFEGMAIIQETEPPLEVHVDRPFMFAVMHKPSNTVLYLGKILDPIEIG